MPPLRKANRQTLGPRGVPPAPARVRPYRVRRLTNFKPRKKNFDMATRKKKEAANVPEFARAGLAMGDAIAAVVGGAPSPAKRGGVRKGAGRPLEEGERAVTRSLRLYPRTWARIMALAESSGSSEREVIEEALEAYAAKLEGEGE